MSNTEDDQQPEHSEQKQNIPKGIVPEHLLQVGVRVQTARNLSFRAG